MGRINIAGEYTTKSHGANRIAMIPDSPSPPANLIKGLITSTNNTKMKKLIAILSLFPVIAFASSVSIGGVSVTGNSFTGNGSASYTGGDTLSVQLDNSNLLTGSTVANWSVAGTASNGRHTLTALVGSASASQDFVVNIGGGLAPCQIDGTCPNFGLSAPTIPIQDNLGSTKPKYLRPGEGECPIWFTMNCLNK